MNIRNTEIYTVVEIYSNFLWEELRYEVGERNLHMLDLDKVQLVLEPREDDDGMLCDYYFVNHAGRSVFWLEGWDASGVLSKCRGVDTLSHKGKTWQSND